MYRPFRTLATLLMPLLALLMVDGAHAQAALEEVAFVSLPGDRFEIRLRFDRNPPEPQIFSTNNPARISVDFANVSNRLDSRRYPLAFANAESATFVEAQGRTRMVVNLRSPVAYQVRAQGTELFLVIGDDNGGAQQVSQISAPATPQSQPPVPQVQAQPVQAQPQVQPVSPSVQPPPAQPVAQASVNDDIRLVDFRRGNDGEASIIIDLARPNLVGNITQSGNRLQLSFDNASIANSQQMRMDVTDFATPVRYVDVFREGNGVRIVADVVGQYEYLAFQTGGQYVISVTPVLAAVTAQALSPDFSGERISLNFQEIDVRSVLQILADFNDFSLVVSDSVSGSITMRLVNVPWDQALDLVLRARGLGQRLVGDVLYVAPSQEIADWERQALETARQAEALAPLVTEYIPINYAVAADILNLILRTGGGEDGPGARGLLSERGTASVDVRTNTLIIQDALVQINEIRELLMRLDVPVKQVLIEARIVNASTTFSDALGIRWGTVQTLNNGSDTITLGGNLLPRLQQQPGMGGAGGIGGVGGVGTVGGSVGTGQVGGFGILPTPAVNIGQGLMVDLGAPSPTGAFALGYAGNSGLLQLELSALESSGNGEVIAQPKVTTQDKQPARIQSGVQIPYQAQAGGTAGGSTTEFVAALLSLEVYPADHAGWSHHHAAGHPSGFCYPGAGGSGAGDCNQCGNHARIGQ
jgi:type IV pilus assembly protein PilQ